MPRSPFSLLPRHARLPALWCAWALLASLSAWWFGAGSLLPTLALLIIGVPLAIRTYQVTRRRWFLLPGAVPVLLFFALVAGPGAASLVAAIYLPPIIALLAVVACIRLEQLRTGAIRLALTGAIVVCTAAAVSGAIELRALMESFADTPQRLASFAGCYAVERGPSFPQYDHKRWPPAIAVFDTARWTQQDAGTADGAVGGPYYGSHKILSPDGTVGYWEPHGAAFIDVAWTYRGLGGFRGTLRKHDGGLDGLGRWFQDLWTPFPDPVMALHLRTIDCAHHALS